ncbi:prolipoprotein diacylglyceryl transferase family protein [uncultured Bacteroides sp.]|uniref:prolipoprotein diacylglyceryl transferase family protein n=1 Tax=uncultured Bacteroides sp. TaxID=162156 RepID=UPI00374A1F23
MEKMNTKLNKVLYGILFIIVIPALLIVWARYTSNLIQLPIPANSGWGYLLLVSGGFFVVTGMFHLCFLGKGLPMNAFPPKRFVKKGIYAFINHPIYTGAVLISFGVSVLAQSASGFWLVSPLFILMTVAYTVGFENERTLSLFGPQEYKPGLSLPINSEEPPTIKEKIASYILAYLPWLLIYEAFIFTGIPKDAIYTNLPFEKEWPVIEFTTIFYVSVYLYTLLVPLIIKTKKDLRSLEMDIWFATIVTCFIYFIIPFIVDQRPFTPHSVLGKLLAFDRSQDEITASLPSFHVIWAFIAARYFAISLKKLKWFWYLLAILISISCITTGNHSLLDVIAGGIMFAMVVYRIQIWNYIRIQSECIANSWMEWRWGPVRLINHGFYAGAAGFVGALIVGSFMGSHYAFIVFLLCTMAIIGAGLWAQFVEGSSKLQRPYGYYGSVIGVFTGCILVTIFFPINFYVLFAAFTVAAPWVQILGRLRCLVQGCCHGKPSEDWIGIRFTQPYSRVNKISGLKGAALHPSQLYSIGTNLVTGLALIRLLNLEMPATFIIGIYFILNGLGRFVEESFRGEAQTPYWAGMRIYQWIAIVCILFGAVMTTLSNTKMTVFQFNLHALYWAIALGIIAIIAYGVDFPSSNRRFARLTSA